MIYNYNDNLDKYKNYIFLTKVRNEYIYIYKQKNFFTVYQLKYLYNFRI